MQTNSNKECAIRYFLNELPSYHNHIESVETILGNFSNFIFKIKTTDSKIFKVRLANNNNLISRSNELNIIDVYPDKTLLHYDRLTGNAIYTWIEGRDIGTEDITDSFLREVFVLANKYYSKKQVHKILVHDPYDYEHLAGDAIPPHYKELYNLLVEKHKDLPLVLCHNDISLKNMVFTNSKNKIFLFDYEWGRLNTIYWDLGNFVRNCNLDRVKISKLAKIASLEESILIDFCFIAVYYALQLTYSFWDQTTLDEYRAHLYSLLETYHAWLKP